jgi:hypothetical protein
VHPPPSGAQIKVLFWVSTPSSATGQELAQLFAVRTIEYLETVPLGRALFFYAMLKLRRKIYGQND